MSRSRSGGNPARHRLRQCRQFGAVSQPYRADAECKDGRAAVRRPSRGQPHAQRAASGEADQRALNALLVDVMGLDGMLTHLDYDSRSYSSTVQAREFRARMAMLMPQLISTADSLHRLQREPHGLLPELEEYLQAVDR